jgi:hypothetical protein
MKDEEIIDMQASQLRLERARLARVGLLVRRIQEIVDVPSLPPCAACEQMTQMLALARLRLTPHLQDEDDRGQLARAVEEILKGGEVGSG